MDIHFNYFFSSARFRRLIFKLLEITTILFQYGLRRAVVLIAIVCVSCSIRYYDNINIELTDFAKDLVCAFAETRCAKTQVDSTYTFVFLCNDKNVRLFEYSDFSNKSLVGKAIVGGQQVKIYGTECPTIYNRLHKTNEKEETDTDGNYVEDLREWTISMFADTIIIHISDFNERSVLYIRDVCRKYYPKSVLIWQRTSFRLDDIQL